MSTNSDASAHGGGDEKLGGDVRCKHNNITITFTTGFAHFN